MTLGSLLTSHDMITLENEHTTLDVRLKELEKRKSHSPEERYEIQIIKKRKLAIKDRMKRVE
jgi:hypothetical protein